MRASRTSPMSPDTCEILPGALLISDAHYSPRRPQLLSLLQAIESGALVVPQLILMGDIFDLLFGEIAVTHTLNASAVETLQRLCRRLPVLYFEGNHDYNLSGLFPEATVVPLAKQPLACRCGALKVWMAHGDFHQPLQYRIYTALIRHHAVLLVLGVLNRISANAIISKLQRSLDRKDNCYDMRDFEGFVARHLSGLSLSSADVFIEGHYHQGRSFTLGTLRYINASAFACNRRYAIVRRDEKRLTLDTRVWQGA